MMTCASRRRPQAYHPSYADGPDFYYFGGYYVRSCAQRLLRSRTNAPASPHSMATAL
jgi:hypothetical protein